MGYMLNQNVILNNHDMFFFLVVLFCISYNFYREYVLFCKLKDI